MIEKYRPVDKTMISTVEESIELTPSWSFMTNDSPVEEKTTISTMEGLETCDEFIDLALRRRGSTMERFYGGELLQEPNYGCTMTSLLIWLYGEEFTVGG